MMVKGYFLMLKAQVYIQHHITPIDILIFWVMLYEEVLLCVYASYAGGFLASNIITLA